MATQDHSLSDGFARTIENEIHSLSHAVVNRYGHTLERNSDGGGAGSMIVSVIGRHPLRQTIVGFGCGWFCGYVFRSAVVAIAVCGGIVYVAITLYGFQVNWGSLRNQFMQDIRRAAEDPSNTGAARGWLVYDKVAAFTREQRFFSVGFCMGLLFSLSQAVMPWRFF